MTYNAAGELELDGLVDVISNLEIQIKDLQARLEVVEETSQSNFIEQMTSQDGEVRFLGRGFEVKSTDLEATETSKRGAFLGTKYPVTAANVEMTEDGTTRTFLGRKFKGMAAR